MIPGVPAGVRSAAGRLWRRLNRRTHLQTGLALTAGAAIGVGLGLLAWMVIRLTM